MSLIPIHSYKEWYYLSQEYKLKEPDKKYHLKLTEEYFNADRMNTMDIIWFRDKDKDVYLELRRLKDKCNIQKKYNFFGGVKLPKINK